MEVFSIFVVFLITIITLLWLLLKIQYNFWKKRGVVTSPYSLPWGHMKGAVFLENAFADRVQIFYNYLKSRGVKYGGLYLLWFPTFIAIDLDLVKDIVQADFQHFVDRGIYVNEKHDPLSAHLFSLGGKKWKLLRNKLTPTFTSGKMKIMYDTLLDCTKGLYKVMDKETGNSIDIKDIAGRFTTDIIGSCAFGINCNSLENPNSEFREKGKVIFHRKFPDNVKQIMLFLMPDFMKIFNTKTLPDDVINFFVGVVKSNVEYREKNNIFRKDFMHLLIQLKNSGKLVDDEKLTTENITEAENSITINEIVAQAFVFFEAGFETSSTTMTFCLYELAKNKEIQDRLRDEIRKIFEKYDNKITYEAVMEMDYLDNTINETLRKYPPLPSLNRVCTKEYKVPNTNLILEKGQKVLIPVYGIHMDPEYYPEPGKFDPDRFTVENKRKRPAFSFIPFGEGPRICIGMRFGMMQTKVGLIALLLNYEFSVSSRTQEPLKFDPESFITSTKGGVWLDFKKISAESIELC